MAFSSQNRMRNILPSSSSSFTCFHFLVFLSQTKTKLLEKHRWHHPFSFGYEIFNSFHVSSCWFIDYQSNAFCLILWVTLIAIYLWTKHIYVDCCPIAEEPNRIIKKLPIQCTQLNFWLERHYGLRINCHYKPENPSIPASLPTFSYPVLICIFAIGIFFRVLFFVDRKTQRVSSSLFWVFLGSLQPKERFRVMEILHHFRDGALESQHLETNLIYIFCWNILSDVWVTC